MGVEDRAGVLGVVLCADIPAAVGQLNDLGEATLGVHTSNSHARVLKTLAILIVELEAVTMTLFNVRLTSTKFERKTMNVDTLMKFLAAMDCELIIRSRTADKSEWKLTNE